MLNHAVTHNTMFFSVLKGSVEATKPQLLCFLAAYKNTDKTHTVTTISLRSVISGNLLLTMEPVFNECE